MICFFIGYEVLARLVFIPRLLDASVRISPAAALVGALAGYTMLGVIGFLISIPLVAVLTLILREVVLPARPLASRSRACFSRQLSCRLSRSGRVPAALDSRLRARPGPPSSRSASAGGRPPRRSSAGQTTTCGMPAASSWSQPGQR